MQGVFYIKPNGIKEAAGEYRLIGNELKSCITRLNAVKNSLDGSYGEIKTALSFIEDMENGYVRGIGQLEQTLDKVASSYDRAEKTIQGIPFYCKTPKSITDAVNDFSEDDDKTELLKKILDYIKEFSGSNGELTAQLTPVLEILSSILLGEDVNPAVISQFALSAPANLWSFFFNVNEQGWGQALREGVGLAEYFNKGTSHTIRGAFGQELKEFVDFSNTAKGAKAVAKWAGVAVTGIFNGVENYEEYQSGQISSGRAVAETVIETSVDVAVGTAATAVAAGIVGAIAGTAMTPVILVGAAAAGIVVGANWIVEKISGKDIGEHAADFFCDIGEGAAGLIGGAGKAIAKWFK